MIESISSRFGCTDRRAKSPMPSDVKFEKCSASDVVPTSTFEYMSCVGALLYLALTVRTDIALVGQLSRYMSCPTPDCVRVAKRCMNYLYITRLRDHFQEIGKWEMARYL